MLGRIKSLTRGQGCGYIRDTAGRNLFFHKADVLNNEFNDLEVGVAVRFEVIDDPISGARAQRVKRDTKTKRPRREATAGRTRAAKRVRSGERVRS